MGRENDLPVFCLSFYLMVILVAKVDVGTSQTTSSPAVPPLAASTDPPPTRLRIAVPVKRGFKEFVRVTDDGKNFSGFAIELFRAVISASLPKSFTYEFIAFAKPDGTMNGTYDTMLKAVHDKEYDAAVGDINIEYARSSQWVKFTTPYLDSGNTMLVRVKASGISSFPSWLIIPSLSVFLITALVFCILEYTKKNDNDYGAHETQIMHRERMRAIRDTRVVMVLWFAVLLLLTTCYVASLTSLLIPGRPKIDTRTLTQLKDAKEKVGYSNTSFIYNVLTYAGFLESQLVSFQSEEEMQDLLSKGTVAAVVHRTRYLQLFLAKRSCDNKYALSASFETLTGGFGFAFQKDSPWTGSVSDGILQLMDNGQLGKIQGKTVGSFASCEDDTTTGVGSDILLNTAIAGMACIAFVLAILYAIYFSKMCKSTSE